MGGPVERDSVLPRLPRTCWYLCIHWLWLLDYLHGGEDKQECSIMIRLFPTIRSYFNDMSPIYHILVKLKAFWYLRGAGPSSMRREEAWNSNNQIITMIPFIYLLLLLLITHLPNRVYEGAPCVQAVGEWIKRLLSFSPLKFKMSISNRSLY